MKPDFKPDNAPLQQSDLFAQALGLMGREVIKLSMPHAEGFALRRRPFPALLSRGPRWHATADVTAQAESIGRAAEQGVRLINAECASHAAALRRAGFRQILTAAHIAELDLTQSLKTLRASAKGKWRNRLVTAEAGLSKRRKLLHRPLSLPRDAWLLEAEAAQRKRRRYRAWAPELVHAMALAQPESLRFFSLEEHGRSIAAMLFVQHGARASYHIGWSGPAGRAANAHTLLLWAAMSALKARGVQTLELGSLDTETAPSLARFKLGSGAKARALGGTWLRLKP